MPSRQNPRPSKAPRRRPGPYLPGSLILMLVAVALVVALFWNNGFSASKPIEYSDFLKLVEAKNIKKVTFVGKDRLVGEVVNVKAPEAEALQQTNGHFSVSLLQANDRTALGDRIRANNPDATIG